MHSLRDRCVHTHVHSLIELSHFIELIPLLYVYNTPSNLCVRSSHSVFFGSIPLFPFPSIRFNANSIRYLLLVKQ